MHSSKVNITEIRGQEQCGNTYLIRSYDTTMISIFSVGVCTNYIHTHTLSLSICRVFRTYSCIHLGFCKDALFASCNILLTTPFLFVTGSAAAAQLSVAQPARTHPIPVAVLFHPYISPVTKRYARFCVGVARLLAGLCIIAFRVFVSYSVLLCFSFLFVKTLIALLLEGRGQSSVERDFRKEANGLLAKGFCRVRIGRLPSFDRHGQRRLLPAFASLSLVALI